VTRAFLLAALIAAGASAHPAEAAARGCADHWTVELDGDSFANNGAGTTFAPAQLQAFRIKLEQVLKQGIAAACKQGKVKPPLAARVRRVTVVSASGHTEPYFDPLRADLLGLYWVFAEADLAVPSRDELLDGLACWTRPKSGACALLQQD